MRFRAALNMNTGLVRTPIRLAGFVSSLQAFFSRLQPRCSVVSWGSLVVLACGGGGTARPPQASRTRMLGSSRPGETVRVTCCRVGHTPSLTASAVPAQDKNTHNSPRTVYVL